MPDIHYPTKNRKLRTRRPLSTKRVETAVPAPRDRSDRSAAMESLRQEILSAFAAVPRPGGAHVFQGQIEEHGKAGEFELASGNFGLADWLNYYEHRQILQSGETDDLPPSFWEKGVRLLGALTPEAYLYYLPRSLLAALDQVTLLEGAYCQLSPQLRQIYRLGYDPHFECQISLFTPQQHRAVCSFLSHCFDYVSEHSNAYLHTFEVTRACYWGWNRESHPFLHFCRDFHQRMRNFEYPGLETVKDAELRHLVTLIRCAFADTPPPGATQLSVAPQIDMDDSEIELQFAGADWQKLHPHFTARYHGALSALLEPAFRYFFPAYLIASLQGRQVDANYQSHAEPLYHLINPWGNEPEFFINYRKERFANFTKSEKQGIVAYLRYCKGGAFDWDDLIEREIREFWER